MQAGIISCKALSELEECRPFPLSFFPFAFFPVSLFPIPFSLFPFSYSFPFSLLTISGSLWNGVWLPLKLSVAICGMWSGYLSNIQWQSVECGLATPLTFSGSLWNVVWLPLKNSVVICEMWSGYLSNIQWLPVDMFWLPL